MDGSLGRLDGEDLSLAAPYATPRVKIGVALLDNPAASHGWCGLAGGQPEKFKSLNSLPSDTIWWLNLDRTTFLERGQTSHNASFRFDKWLGIQPSKALAELGAGEILENGSSAVQVLCGALNNLQGIFDHLAGGSNVQIHQLLRTFQIARGLVGLVGDSTTMTPDMRAKFDRSTLYNGYIRTGLTPGRTRSVRFTRPNLAYVMDVLKASVPRSSVSWPRPLPGDPMTEIRKSTVPILADITVSRAAPQAAGIYSFNHSDGRGGMPRTTATHPELLALDGFGILEIHAIWTGDAYVRAFDTLPSNVQSFLRDPGCLVSWSSGIAAREILRAMTCPQYSRSGTADFSWRAMWLRAADRVTSFRHAVHMSKSGFTPVCYGSGWMECQVPNDPALDIKMLLSAMELGYLPAPGTFAPDVLANAHRGKYGPAGPAEGWGYAAFMADALMTGRGDLIRLADRAPLLDSDAQRRLLGFLGREMRRLA